MSDSITKTISLTWEEWEEQFKPIPNHFQGNDSFIHFETFGDEVAFVKAQDEHKIWTYMEGDSATFITEGWHFVNRLGYFITTVPWEDGVYYEVDLQPWAVGCEDCGEAETKDGELVMETFACPNNEGYCLNCCGCDEHKGEKWYE